MEVTSRDPRRDAGDHRTVVGDDRPGRARSGEKGGQKEAGGGCAPPDFSGSAGFRGQIRASSERADGAAGVARRWPRMPRGFPRAEGARGSRASRGRPCARRRGRATGRPTSARSPSRSSALWRTNSSAKRRSPFSTRSSPTTMQLSSRAPRARPCALSVSYSDEKPERASRREVRGVGLGREDDRDRLPSDGRVREVDRVRHAQVARGADLELPAARLGDGEDARRGERDGERVLRDEARGLERVEPGERAAVEDGHFGAVELHEDVVEARAHSRRKEVLHRRHVAAALTERSSRGRSAPPPRRRPERRRRRRTGRRRSPWSATGRMQDDLDVAARVQPDSGQPDSPGEGVLRAHSGTGFARWMPRRMARFFSGFRRIAASCRRRGVWQKPLTCGFSVTPRPRRPFVQNGGCYPRRVRRQPCSRLLKRSTIRTFSPCSARNGGRRRRPSTRSIPRAARFRLKAQFGFGRTDRLAERLGRNDTLVNYLYEHREPTFVNNVNLAGKLTDVMVQATSTRMLLAPLYLDGRIMGLVDVREKAGRQRFSQDDITRDLRPPAPLRDRTAPHRGRARRSQRDPLRAGAPDRAAARPRRPP